MPQPAPFARILDDVPRRTLAISPPPVRVDKIVVATLAQLEKRHKAQLEKAKATIEKFGLTIEATRLRDRLSRAAVSDLERLLLSTPGVPEALFNAALEKELEDEEAEEQSRRPPRKRPSRKSAPAGSTDGAAEGELAQLSGDRLGESS